jgi:non-homologous end joining protein Ku
LGLIKKKEGREKPAIAKMSAPKGKVVDLMAALKGSLAASSTTAKRNRSGSKATRGKRTRRAA